MTGLYFESYKTLMTKIKEDSKKWKDTPWPCSWNGKIKITKIAFILPKEIYRFHANPIKLPRVFFTELEQVTLKFIWNHIISWNCQSTLKKKKKTGSKNSSRYQIILLNYSNQNPMVLAQKQAHRSMKSQEIKP